MASGLVTPLTTTVAPEPMARRTEPPLVLPFPPALLPALRAGMPPGRSGGSSRGLVALPQRGQRETALVLTVSGFPGLCLDLERERGWVNRQSAEPEIDRVGLAYLRGDRSGGTPTVEQTAVVGEMLRLGEYGRLRALKAELLGPVSLALQLVDEQERPLAYDPALREALLHHVILRAAWLYDQMGGAADGAVICLDEPFLDALGSPFCPLDWEEGGELLARALADLPGCGGVCTSGPVNWPALLALPTGVVFFDAYEHGAGLIKAASAVAGYLDRGGVLGWGIVPNDPAALTQERPETLARRLESTGEYLAAASGLAVEQIWAASLVSTSGRVAHLPPSLASQAADMCFEVSLFLRAKYQLTKEGLGEGSSAPKT